MDGTTLKTKNYRVEFSSGSAKIYATDKEGFEHWLATVPDIETATRIVEGLILVEMKRFYYPESKPVFKQENNILDVSGGKDEARRS